MAILDPARLDEAIELQRRSYALLKWLGDAIPRGFISFDSAHQYADSATSAFAWIGEHFDNLPAAARPIDRDVTSMKRFANFFASYLETSFDLEKHPGTRLESHCGCYCSFCAVAVSAPHLRAKRLGKPDKARATELALVSLRDLAASQGQSFDHDYLGRLLSERATRERAALVAYAQQLFRRCDGAYTGPWVLALWRIFAWRETGSPKPDFELTPELILDAERALLEELAGAAV